MVVFGHGASEKPYPPGNFRLIRSALAYKGLSEIYREAETWERVEFGCFCSLF
jgi:hypothetical protein